MVPEEAAARTQEIRFVYHQLVTATSPHVFGDLVEQMSHLLLLESFLINWTRDLISHEKRKKEGRFIKSVHAPGHFE